jgi:phosphohistidine phosphatase
MERLIIFRHGKAERDSASGEDFDRALTDRGRADAEAIGRMLAMSGSSPDLALVSSAVRAVQTYEAARPAFPRAAVKTSKDLYLASAGALMRAAHAEDAACIMLVAHNPGLHDLAVALAREGRVTSADRIRLEEGFPTSAAAVFRFDADGTPQLVALHTPKGRG